MADDGVGPALEITGAAASWGTGELATRVDVTARRMASEKREKCIVNEMLMLSRDANRLEVKGKESMK